MRITNSDILDFLTYTLVPQEIYVQQVLKALSKIFCFQSIAFWTDCKDYELHSPALNGITDNMLNDYIELYKNFDPLYPTNNYPLAFKKRVLTIDDIKVPKDPIFYSDIYFDFVEKYLIVPLVCIYLFDHQQNMIGALAINRRPGDRELLESEKGLFKILGKHVSNKMANNSQNKKLLSSCNETLPTSEALGYIIFDDQINMIDFNSQGINILHQIYPQKKKDDLLKCILGSLVPKITFPVIDQEERILLSASGETFRIQINRLFNSKKNSERKYIVSILPGIIPSILERSTYQVQSLYNLTQREHEILCMLQKGYSNQQIADELLITLRTVKAHIHNMFEKTGVNTRSKLIYKITT